MTRKRRLSFASVLALATAVLLLTTAVVCVADVRNAYADDAAASVSVWDGTSSDTSCYSFATNEIVINSAAQLRGIADMSNNGFDFSPYTIKLNTDIDLNGKEWIPFTNYGGVFDGQGHTISNGNIKASDSDGTGFFGRLNKVTTIKDLVFKKMTTKNENFGKLAIVAGTNSANGTTFDNVDLINCYVCGRTDWKGAYSANAFYLSSSTGAIKVVNCDIQYGLIVAGNTSGIAYSITGDYQSVITDSNIYGTFFITKGGDRASLIVCNGGSNTLVRNCYSDLFPSQSFVSNAEGSAGTCITLDGIENEFTAEQQQIITENAGTAIFQMAGSSDVEFGWTQLESDTYGVYYKSTNQNFGNSKCEMVFDVETGATLSFDYANSGEAASDYLHISSPEGAIDASDILSQYTTDAEVLADASKWKSFSYTNTTTETVQVKVWFEKDALVQAGTDAGYLKNIANISSGAVVLMNATLDSQNIAKELNASNGTLFKSKSYQSFGFELSSACEYEVSVDGTVSTDVGSAYNVDLSNGLHEIIFKYTSNGISKSYSLVVGIEDAFKIVDASGNQIEKAGMSAAVSSLSSAYKLVPTKNITGSTTFKVNSNDITTDGVAFVKNEGLGGFDGFSAVMQVAYGEQTATYNWLVSKGFSLSGEGDYPWTYVADGNYFKSTNQNKGGDSGTESKMTLVVLPGNKVTFDYVSTCEGSSDYLALVDPDGNEVTTKQNGCDADLNTMLSTASLWKTYEYANTTNEAATISIRYVKDSSVDKGADTACIRNFASSTVALDTGDIPSKAKKLQDNLYYVSGDFNYDSSSNQFSNTGGNSSTITYYVDGSAIFRFIYAIEASADRGYNAYVTIDDSPEITLYGTSKQDVVFNKVLNSDEVHIVSIRYEGPSYWYCHFKDVTVTQLNDYNVNVEIVGNGAVYDIIDFGNVLCLDGYTKQTYDQIQLFGRADVNSSNEFVGYQIKNADGTWGELIKSNGDIFTVTSNMYYRFVFSQRVPILGVMDYTLTTNGVATKGVVGHAQKISIDKLMPNTQLIFSTPVIAGVSGRVYDSVKGTEEELQIDNNAYFYTIDDVSVSRTIKFIYEKEGCATTEFIVYVSFEADINSYLIANDSKPIEVINDDDINYQYNASLSSNERFAYTSLLGATGKKQHKIASNIGFKVQGQGVLVFDYYINSEDRGETEKHNTKHTGDRAIYGKNQRISWGLMMDSTADNSGYINPSYTSTVGYLGAALGTEDFSKCQGQLGWQRVSIPVVASSDDEYNTVYIAYVKDWEDTIETEDTFAIANVMFVQGNFNVSFNTNTSTGSVSATANGSAITSGQSVGAGSLITLTATDSDSSARFVGWFNGEEKLVSKNRTINFGLGNEINYQAVFANSQNPYVVKNKTFATLSNAVSSIGSEQGLVRLLANAQEDDINVPSNITLLLAYSDDDEEGLLVGGGNDRVSWNCGVDPYVTLTVNGKLTLNGKLIVGGVQHKADQSAQGHTSGAYAQMIVNGSVEIANGGYLDVIGRVTGNGTITAKNGATLRQPFTVNNYAGGTNTYALYGANQFPFVQFATINVECKQVVEYGAKVIGSTSLYFWSSITTQDVVLVDKIENRTSEGEGALIWMQADSHLEISYDSSKKIDSKVGNIHLGDFGVTTIDVYGNITAGEFYLQNYGSAEMVLAIPYTYNFNIKSGATVTIDQAYKIMPGAIVTIDNGATVNITENGTLYVYDGLIQADKSGKAYPSADILGSNKFAKSGMLIVNGTLNINGAFAGIAQTVEGGEIVVGANANVANQTIVDGCIGGYKDEESSNETKFEMSGRVYGVNGFVNLEKGKTYRTFANNAFTLKTFTVKSASRMDNLSVELNQAMGGRFAEWNGEKFVLTLTFYVGTERVYVTINDTPCMTDNYGKFTCTVEVASASEAIKYFTTKVYTAEQSQTLVLDQEMQTLTHVASGVTLNIDNVYTRVYDKGGNITQNFSLFATVSFYGTTETESVALSFDESALDSSVYVNNGVALTNSSLVNSLSATLNVVGRDVAQFIDDVNNLKNADDIVATAIDLYDVTYKALTSKGTGDDVTFITNYLNDYIEFAGKIVKEITITGSATYGDGEVGVQITYVDGTTATATATLSDWRMDNSRIVATATLTCDYQGKKYNITNTCDGSKKAVTLNAITSDSAVYDGNMHTVTATLSGLAKFDNDTLVYATATFGENVGEYNATFELAGDKAVFYTLTGDTAHTCTVTAKDITVTVKDAQAIVGKTETVVLVANASGNVDEITFTFAIYKGETLVATVGKDGKVTLADGQSLAMGEYTVKAVTDNVNYNIASQTEGTLKVVEANEYYDVDFNLGGTSKVYDGNVLALNPTVTVKATGELVDASKYTVSVTGKGTQILEVGTYQITVTLDGETIAQESFNVTEKDVTVTIKPQSSVYGEDINVDQTAYTASGVVGNNDLKVTLTIDNSARNAGKYDIVGAWNNHNYKVTFVGGEKAYEITAKAIVVEIENKESFYGAQDAVLSAKLNGSLAYTDSFDSLGIKLVRKAGKNAGTYAITLDSWTNENYTITAENATYTVKKLALRAIVANATSVYGDPIANLTFTIEGKFAEGESVDVLNAKLSIGNAKNAGTYGIEFAYDNANYDVSATNATYTITKREVTLLVQDATSVYGDADTALTVGITKGTMAYGENENTLVSIMRAEGRNVGTYAITATKADNANYDVTIAYTSATNSVYTITKRPVTVTVKNAELPYTATWANLNAALEYESNGLAGDELNVRLFVLVGGVELTADNFGSMFAGGTHVISASIDNGNYELNVVNGTLTVGLPVVSLTDAARGITRVYGNTQNVFNWRTMLAGYLASATDNTFRAAFYSASDLTTPVDIATAGAGAYKMQIEIVHTTAYTFADGSNKSELVDVTVEKADLTDAIVITLGGLTDGGYLVFSYGLSIDASVTGHDDIEIVKVLVKDGAAADEIDSVGAYVYTATIQDANYQGAKTLEFKVVNSAKEKIEGLKKYAGVEFLTRAQYAEAKALLESITEDDTLQINDEAEAKANYANAEALCANYAKVAANLDEIKVMLDAYAAGEDKKLIEAHDYIVALDEEKLALVKQSEEGKAYQEAWQAARAAGSEATEIANKVRDNVLFGVVAAVSALLAMAYVAFGKFRV